MNIILGADQAGFDLKNSVKDYLTDKGYSIIDIAKEPASNFVESASALVNQLNAGEDNLAIAFDGYGAGSFMAATKFKGVVAAEISDERSAYMTREHNNARMITLGSEIVGKTLAINIVSEFLRARYDGGRHQIRVDMLNKMY